MINEDIKPQDLIGKLGEAYNGIQGKIINAVYFKDWESIEDDDSSGWMCGSDFDEMLEEYDDYDILVSLESEQHNHGINVYVYGGEGVVIA